MTAMEHESEQARQLREGAQIVQQDATRQALLAVAAKVLGGRPGLVRIIPGDGSGRRGGLFNGR